MKRREIHTNNLIKQYREMEKELAKSLESKLERMYQWADACFF
jgi:hypothetical protein